MLSSAVNQGWGRLEEPGATIILSAAEVLGLGSLGG